MTPKRLKKPWGEEILFAQTGRYAGKILKIRAGESLSLQYHERKEETLYVQEGSLRVLLPDADPDARDRTLGPGASVHLPPMTKHRLEARTDCVVFEVSTPDLDDVVRLEDRYGRV